MTAAGRQSQPLFHIRCTAAAKTLVPVYDVHHICISNYTAPTARVSRDFLLFFRKSFFKNITFLNVAFLNAALRFSEGIGVKVILILVVILDFSAVPGPARPGI